MQTAPSWLTARARTQVGLAQRVLVEQLTHRTADQDYLDAAAPSPNPPPTATGVSPRRWTLSRSFKTTGVAMLLASQAMGRTLQQGGSNNLPLARGANGLTERWPGVNSTATRLALPTPDRADTQHMAQSSQNKTMVPMPPNDLEGVPSRVNPPLGLKLPMNTNVLATPLGGCSYSLYTVKGTAGGQQQDWALDTGSSDLLVAGSDCKSCNGATPLYTPGAAAQELASFQLLAYGSGGASGPVYSDIVSIAHTPMVNISLLDAARDINLLNWGSCGSSGTGPSQGILGIGPKAMTKLGPNTFMGAVQNATGATAFATQLCNVGGLFWATGYDASALAGPIQYTPMKTTSYYLVSGMEMRLGDESLNFSASQPGPIAVDTGTNFLSLPELAYDTLARKGNPLTQHLLGQDFFSDNFAVNNSFRSSGRCAEFSNDAVAQLDGVLPVLTISFPDGKGATIDLPMAATHSYLTVVPSNHAEKKLVCNNLQRGLSRTPNGAWLFPNNLMQEHVLIWDTGNQALGFAPQNRSLCPTSALLPALGPQSGAYHNQRHQALLALMATVAAGVVAVF